MRLSRLINLIMLLLRRDIVSATELAQIFEVTPRSIYRDVETLSMAGIPIYTIRGRNGGIGLLPTYKVDKKLLNAADINNLSIALASVKSLITNPDIEATIQKIQAMYAADEQNMDLFIEHTNWTGAIEIKQIAEKISRAIKKHQYLIFTYNDREGKLSQRKIEPYRLVYKGDRWYVQGYSVKRQDFRIFRLARISALEFSEETFTTRALPVEKLALKPFGQPVVYPLKVQVSILARDSFVERFGSQTIGQMSKEQFSAVISLPNTENSYRLLLSFGNRLQIISEGVIEIAYKEYLRTLAAANGLLS